VEVRGTIFFRDRGLSRVTMFVFSYGTSVRVLQTSPPATVWLHLLLSLSTAAVQENLCHQMSTVWSKDFFSWL